MSNQEEKHFVHYLILVLGLAGCLGMFFYFRADRFSQLILAAVGSLFYCLWGIIHHATESRLTLLIALEYILYGIFVFALLFLVLYF